MNAKKAKAVLRNIAVGLWSERSLIVLEVRADAYKQFHAADRRKSRPTPFEELKAGAVALRTLTEMWRNEKYGERLRVLVAEFVQESA